MSYNEFNEAYKAGTFKIGQKLFGIESKIHYINEKFECECCDNTGKVVIKGKEYICPACRGQTVTWAVEEWTVGDELIIVKSIFSFKNANIDGLEFYVTNENGYGKQIKRYDNKDWFFKTREEAQKECDRRNRENYHMLINGLKEEK